jgi:hypothetical protein
MDRRPSAKSNSAELPSKAAFPVRSRPLPGRSITFLRQNDLPMNDHQVALIVPSKQPYVEIYGELFR